MGDIRTGTLEHNAWIKQVASPYSSSQVKQWLRRMGMDDAILPPPSLQNLEQIVKHHLITFPFEYTDMHYTAHHSMDITPEGIFNRLVRDSRGGSYCFGLNGLMLYMLRGLHYRAFAGLARVNFNGSRSGGSPNYGSLTHQVIFVQPEANSNQTYVVDVGFGAGLVRPILLSNAEDNIVMGIDTTEKHRLTRTGSHNSSVETSKGSDTSTQCRWNLEVWRQDPKSEIGPNWRILYSFIEEEFHDQDFSDASFLVCSKPETRRLSWNHIVCVKYFLEDESRRSTGTKEIAYCKSLIGNVVKRVGEGRSEIIKTLDTELDRVRALRDIFDIDIHDEDTVHIVGRIPALDREMRD